MATAGVKEALWRQECHLILRDGHQKCFCNPRAFFGDTTKKIYIICWHAHAWKSTGSPVPSGNLAYPRESREYCALRGNENRKHFLLQMSLQLIQMIAKQLDNDNIPTTNHVTAYCHQLIISQRMHCPTALRPLAQELAA